MTPRTASEPAKQAQRRAVPTAIGSCGRIMPLAFDEAAERLDAAVFSVATGGLSRRQISEAPIFLSPSHVATVVLRRIRSAVRACAFK